MVLLLLLMGIPIVAEEALSISAKSAVLYDALSGQILYAKNEREPMGMASTTKIMTALVAMEQYDLQQPVTVETAWTGIEGSSMYLKADEKLTVSDLLYGLLLASGNDAAAALAGLDPDGEVAFVEKMNKKAALLGLANTHFENPEGLHDENHYTTAYDLALIACAFFSNDYLANIANTARVHFEPTATQPDDFYLNNKNKLISGEIKYEYYLGGKTGYTSDARQTLVSCAEKDGMRLVCVVMKEESPDQFNDTVTLFNYGFSNFKKVNVSEVETKYTIENTGFFSTGQDIFGSSKSILQLDSDACIVIPAAAEFSDVKSTISYDNLSDGQVATINYTYNDVFVGSVSVNLSADNENYEFNTSVSTQNSVTIINVKKVILWIIGSAVVLSAIFFVARYINQYHFGGKKGRLAKKRRRRNVQRTVSPYRKFNFDDIDLRK